MARYVELRRPTDSDGDALTEDGVRAALGVARIEPMAKGAGVLVIAEGDEIAVEPLD